MQTFTGWQYLLIDVCNQYGLDKMLFEERITWAEANLDILESLVDQADKKPLYMKACQAIRAAQRGEPSGHLVGFDAVCSGIQIMAAITGCPAGAASTGLTNPNVRADAYTLTTDTMNAILGSNITIPRDDAKKCLMTAFYGSKNKPKEILGEDSPELDAFYQAAQIVAPGPWELLQDLLASWQPWALEHAWQLPDGYDAKVKVMDKIDARIEVDELDHATFTYTYYDNVGTKKGLSIAANVVHSIDGYVLRAMHRRCNYDPTMVPAARYLINKTLGYRRDLGLLPSVQVPTGKTMYYIEQYQRSNMADVVFLPYLTPSNIDQLPTTLLEKLSTLIDQMQMYKPFPIVTIHDEFKCHPNNLNHLRQQYIYVMADLAESEILSDVLNQITGYKGKWMKKSRDLGTHIRLGNYALS
jgi:DNA-dependent RNA polymerase